MFLEPVNTLLCYGSKNVFSFRRIFAFSLCGFFHSQILCLFNRKKNKLLFMIFFQENEKNFRSPEKSQKKLKVFINLLQNLTSKLKNWTFFVVFRLSVFYYSSISGVKIYFFTSKLLLLFLVVLWSPHRRNTEKRKLFLISLMCCSSPFPKVTSLGSFFLVSIGRLVLVQDTHLTNLWCEALHHNPDRLKILKSAMFVTLSPFSKCTLSNYKFEFFY